MTQTEPLLKISGIHASYGQIKALRNVSLEVKRGEIVTLIGSNGAGKSTLLMSIFGNPRISQGEIFFSGENLKTVPTHHISSKGIALVPEGRHIFPKMTVEENLTMGTICNKGADLEEGIANAYEMFPRLKERRLQNAGTMSGGEQQMLAIGGALMSIPELLLLDEPSLGLAPIIVQRIFENLKEISKKGTTIFLVEQNASKALKLADRGYVLVTGEITLEGKGQELLDNPQIQEAYLGH